MGQENQESKLRKEAEKKLQELGKVENLRSMSADKADKIARTLHDLRVHQIELEMQNENLRQLEIKLNLSSKRYLELYDFAPVGYSTLNEQGLILEANLTIASILGLERKDLLNKMISNFIFKADQDIFYFFKKRLIETGKSQACELRMIKHNDGQFLVRLEGIDSNGEIRLILSDINELKELHKKNSTQQAELRYIYQALNNSAILTFTDSLGDITYVNDKFCQISKYSKEELIGKNHRMLKSGYHNDQFYKELWITISSGNIWTGEIKNRAKDGNFYWVYTTIVPSLDEHGKPFQYISIKMDITNKKDLEKELFKNQMEKQVAEEILEEKSKFMDIAAHELRTPITSLSLLLQTAERLLEGGQPLNAIILSKLRRPTDRLARLVTELLDVSRQKRGLIVLCPVETDIGLLISECLEDFTIQTPNHHFVFNNLKQAIKINIDPLRISQVLINLLDNAIKYAGQKEIEVTLTDMANTILVSISDRGVGISSDLQAKLFTAFSRGSTDETMRASGLGLGLSICKGIIELHNGKIGVESVEGKGSTFYFELPKQNNKI